MSRKPPIALALALLAMGCTKPDPTNARLQPGALAVVVAGPSKAALRAERGVVELAPGTMVRVGDDPGEYAQTRAQFDAVIEAAPGGMSDEERAAGPRVYPEGHPKARFRSVQVVVESGEHRGKAGNVGRLHLMPAP